jgi:ribosomal RNA-processing protein 12
VINDEDAGGAGGKRKRRGGDDVDSDDSDLDDLRDIKDLRYALKAAGKSAHFADSVAGAKSMAASLGGKSAGARSAGGRSAATSAGGRSAAAGAGKGSTHHSGDRFKPKKSSTGGDVKGSNKVEPYAYWSFDRKMLNRRQGKKAFASKSLTTVVRAAKAGAARGAKAKRQRVD